MSSIRSVAEAVQLAATGSDLAPYLIIAGVIIVLGAIALIVSRVIRARRLGAATKADAGREHPISPDDSR